MGGVGWGGGHSKTLLSAPVPIGIGIGIETMAWQFCKKYNKIKNLLDLLFSKLRSGQVLGKDMSEVLGVGAFWENVQFATATF